MALDFPNTPSLNEVYQVGTRTYVWDGNAWNLALAPLTALNSISVNDTGGAGSLLYDPSTGIFTYAGASTAEIRSAFSADSGVTLTNGQIGLDTTVVRTSGTQTVSAKILENTTLNRTITYQTYTMTSGVLDPFNGTIQKLNMTGTVFLSDNMPPGTSIVLMVTGANSHQIFWPNMIWVGQLGNVTPQLTASDTVILWKVDTTLYGAWVGSSA
jgi:hypothetical protein